MIPARLLTLLLLLFVAACDQQSDDGLSGTVRIDGSSTMYPISEAIAEEYLGVQPNVRVTVGVSGTGGGFKKLLAGETEINNASRMITTAELAALAASGERILELPIAYDGLSVVVNAKNDWVDYLTLDELNSIWQSGSQIKTWQDVRAGWPDERIELYGPGADSGTFDYFTERVNGSSQSSRADFSASEDDNLLVQGIAGDRFALGYFGFVYYFENRDVVRLVPVDSGMGPVAPSAETISSGQYSPLTRPVFLYVSETALARPEVADFVEFYLDNLNQLLPEVGYFELPEGEQKAVRLQYEKRIWLTPLPSVQG
jgi:phosphate transport system substrate-binding protein